VLAIWDGSGDSEYGLSFPDPRLAQLGWRVMLPPHLAGEAASDIGAALIDAEAYEAHRIALGVPRGGLDFIYGDTFPHEADMDQLNGVDFDKGCYVGQEVVSRVEHRASARNRVVPIAYDEFAPTSGLPVMAGDKQVGMLGSTAKGRGLALLRLDRVGDAHSAGIALEAGGIAIRVVKPAWATFDLPGEAKAAT
jgi:folate-binding protein YgfZ